MTTEVRIEQFGHAFDAIAVDGRPADCTKLALSTLWPARFGRNTRPDLVISGMNMGANVGINVIYSGTVAAAIEAAFLGVPAIAVSQHLGKGVADYPAAATHARRAIEKLLDGLGRERLEAHEMININIPRCEFDDDDRHEPTPITVCPMNTHAVNDRYERRESPAGDAYYWSTSDGMDFAHADEGTDVELLLRRHITVTPLTYDLTRRSRMDRMKQAIDG